MNQITIEHIAWQVEFPEKVAAWYGENFGFTVRRKFDNPARAHFLADASGHVVLEIYNNPKASLPDYPSMDPLLLHLAFRTEDPERLRNTLVAAGASIVDDLQETSAGDNLVMLRDPWGFAIQLVKRKQPL